MWPETNWGTPTGLKDGVFVLDLDSAEAVARAVERGLPETPMVETGNGLHVYFAYPSDLMVRNRAGIEPGVDLRGEGGLVVLPGSRHESGHVYRHKADRDFSLPLAQAPDWLLELIRADTRRPSVAVISGRTQVGNMVEGTRNDSLHRIGGLLRRYQLDEDEIEFVLQQVNVAHCEVPLDPLEVQVIAHSLARYEPGTPSVTEQIRRLGLLLDQYHPGGISDRDLSCLVDGHLHGAAQQGSITYTCSVRQLSMHAKMTKSVANTSSTALADAGLVRRVRSDAVAGTMWQLGVSALIAAMPVPAIEDAPTARILGELVPAHALAPLLPTYPLDPRYVPYLRFLDQLGVSRKIFKALASDGAMTVSEISKATGMPSSSAARHRTTLLALGLVEKRPRHRYALVENLAMAMERAWDSTGLTGQWDEREVRYAEEVRSYASARQRYEPTRGSTALQPTATREHLRRLTDRARRGGERP